MFNFRYIYIIYIYIYLYTHEKVVDHQAIHPQWNIDSRWIWPYGQTTDVQEQGQKAVEDAQVAWPGTTLED